MEVRRALEADASEISSLVCKSALTCKEDFDDSGWDFFIRLNGIPEAAARIKNSDNIFLCCVEENKIVGIMVIKDFQKLDQLFVDSNYRKMGVARRLWLEAKKLTENSNTLGYYWVRSSTLAVPVYKNFGFIQVGEKQRNNGICYTLLSTTGE